MESTASEIETFTSDVIFGAAAMLHASAIPLYCQAREIDQPNSFNGYVCYVVLVSEGILPSLWYREMPASKQTHDVLLYYAIAIVMAFHSNFGVI